MAASVTGGSIRVEGLRELLRDLGKMEAVSPVELRRELLAIADHVAETGRLYAVGEGLVDEEHAPAGGGLVDRIKPSALAGRGQVLVVDSARRVSPRYPGGYSYPARYEFENGGARAFMRPAVAASAVETGQRLEQFFERLSTIGGFR